MKDSRKSRPAVAAMAAVGALVLLAACASPTMPPGGPGGTGDTPVGKVLTDAEGMTLYTYDADLPDTSNCTGFCTFIWPPVKAPVGAKEEGGFTIIPRAGGTRQWAYKGKPLYTYALDFEPGAAKGDGAEGVWHAAKP